MSTPTYKRFIMNLKNKHGKAKLICLILLAVFFIIFIVNVSKIGDIENYVSFTSEQQQIEGYELSKQKRTLNVVFFLETTELKAVESSAFYNQTDLTTIAFPETVEIIEKGAFSQCSNLQNLIIYASTPPELTGDLFTSSGSKNAKPHENFTIFVPNNSIESYRNSSWNQYPIKPMSQAQTIFDEVESIKQQTKKSLILSLPLFAFTIALIVIHFCERNTVIKNSTRIQELIDYNKTIHFRKFPTRYNNHKVCSSKRAFDNTRLDVYFSYLIKHERLFYQNIIENITYNIQTFNYYKNVIAEMETSATDEFCESINFTLPRFLKLENRIFKRKTLRKPQQNVHFYLTATYTSPKGRNHYSKSATFNYRDLRSSYGLMFPLEPEEQPTKISKPSFTK